MHAPEIKRQPEKAITGLPVFINVAVLDQKHPHMSFYPLNTPPLKGASLWRAILRFCSNDPNNGAVITRAKRDKRAGKGNMLLHQVCRVWTFNWFPFFWFSLLQPSCCICFRFDCLVWDSTTRKGSSVCRWVVGVNLRLLALSLRLPAGSPWGLDTR